MNCNVHVFCKMIFNNKFGFILETVFSYRRHHNTSFSLTYQWAKKARVFVPNKPLKPSVVND